MDVQIISEMPFGRQQMTPEMLKMQQHLVLLIHADNCMTRQRMGRINLCTVPHCQTMKNILMHVMFCQVKGYCSVQHCNSSRQIIYHWITCPKINCLVCMPLKQAKANRIPTPGIQAVDPGFQLWNREILIRSPETQETTGLQISSPRMQEPLPKPATPQPRIPRMQPPPRPTTKKRARKFIRYELKVEGRNPSLQLGTSATIVSQSALGTQATNSNKSGQSGPFNDSPRNPAVQDSNSWRSNLSLTIRNCLVKKLVEAIIQTPDSQAESEKRKANWISYATKIESKVFNIAKTKSEYYHLLAERTYKIQKNLEKQQPNHRNPLTSQRLPVIPKEPEVIEIDQESEPEFGLSERELHWYRTCVEIQRQTRSAQSAQAKLKSFSPLQEQKNDREIAKRIDSKGSRKLTIEECIETLVHAHRCEKMDCELMHCSKLKRILAHAKSCQKKFDEDCRTCQQLFGICMSHSRNCSKVECSIPFCFPMVNCQTSMAN